MQRVKRRPARAGRACAARPTPPLPAPRIRAATQLAPVLGKPDSRLERLVDLAKPPRQRRPNFRIADRFRRRRADGEAPSRTGSSRQVARQSQAIDPLKRLAQRPVIGKRLRHGGTTELPVMRERAEIEIMLVAERPVEARSIHAGRLAQVIERGSGIAGLPEAFDGARERDVGIVGPRPSAPLWLFLYHFE